MKISDMILPSYEYICIFRSLLDPTYEKIKEKLKNRIKEDNPKFCAISLDIWSAYHHGYMGINIHYIHNFVRKMLNLACAPFDKRHTGMFTIHSEVKVQHHIFKGNH